MIDKITPTCWRWLFDGKPETVLVQASMVFEGEGPDEDIEEIASKAEIPRGVQRLYTQEDVHHILAQIHTVLNRGALKVGTKYAKYDVGLIGKLLDDIWANTESMKNDK